jgi:hypothetical protein
VERRDEKQLGGGVDIYKAWYDYFCNQDFVEIGSYPASYPFTAFPWETGPIDFRVGFTPTEPGIAFLDASLRARVGDGNGYQRLIGKCRIVRKLPTPKVLMHYLEGGVELVDAAPPILRHYDPCFTPRCYDVIEAANVGQLHQYAVEIFGVDGRKVHVLFGAPFTLIA